MKLRTQNPACIGYRRHSIVSCRMGVISPTCVRREAKKAVVMRCWTSRKEVRRRGRRAGRGQLSLLLVELEEDRRRTM